MSKKPRILSAQTVARTRLFHVEEVGLEFANGTVVHYERLSASPHGAVLVVPILDEDTVLLIREYAAGVHRYELGLPKGLIETGETVLEAANREMMEEVGYGARDLRHLTSFTLAPGYFGHVTHVVFARDLYEQRNPGDEPEEIEVVPWRMSALQELVAQEDCTEARSIAALYMVRDLLHEEKRKGL
jgi:ADP-ribose diphosphatase